MVNLCEAKPGDGLVAKDGSLFYYYKYRNLEPYKHYIKRKLNDYMRWSVTDEGKHIVNENSFLDIIKIIPQETPNFYFNIYEKLRLYRRTSSFT